MAFYYRPYAMRAKRWTMPRDQSAALAAAGRPPADGVLQTVWLTLSLAAILAAAFGLSCLAYTHLAADCRRAVQGPLGELWNGILP